MQYLFLYCVLAPTLALVAPWTTNTASGARNRGIHALPASAASADAARAAAKEAANAVAANSAQASRAAAEALAQASASSAASADAARAAAREASQAMADSLAQATAKLAPAADGAAASLTRGADALAASAQDLGGRLAESAGELGEALQDAVGGSEGFADGARLAAADAVDAVGTAGAGLSAAYYEAVASAAVAGIGGAEAASAGAVLIAAAAFGTKGIDAAAVKALESDRDTAKRESDALKGSLQELEEKFFLADAQFEQTMAATRKEFDTTLKVRLDTLRAELTREKDAANLSLKQAQDSQLEELKEYYTSRYAGKVAEMQLLIDAKDAKIEELEAALGDPLNLWWKRVTGQEKANPLQTKAPPPKPPTGLYSA